MAVYADAVDITGIFRSDSGRHPAFMPALCNKKRTCGAVSRRAFYGDDLRVRYGACGGGDSRLLEYFWTDCYFTADTVRRSGDYCVYNGGAFAAAQKDYAAGQASLRGGV